MDEAVNDQPTEDKWALCKRGDAARSLVKMTEKEKRQLKRPPRVFSDQFLAYVERELARCEGASDEERLQIHREVFQYMIEQFTEHRKILSDIKVEYDAALRRRDTEIHHMAESERQSAAEKERHSRKLKSAQVHAYRQVDEMQESQAKLRHRLATVLEERQKLKDELMKVRESLLVEQKRYQEEHRVRQEAETDLCDVTQRYENLLRRVNSRPPPDRRSTNAAEDPVVLRVALNKCREELSTTSARLVVLETSYTEVVPKRDFILAQAEIDKVRAQGDERLAELQQVLNQEREKEAFHTPRPDWTVATHFVPGGAEKWLPLMGNEPSCDVLMALLQQLSASGPDTFTPLNFEEQVIPPLLTYQGETRNLRMTRQKVVDLICDIFECKEGNEDPFQEFVFEYFKERYPFSWSDWTCSFHYALERLTADDAHHLLMGLDVAGETTPAPSTPHPPVTPPQEKETGAEQRRSSAPTESPSGRPLSGPERLRWLLEEREHRVSSAGGSGPQTAASGDPHSADAHDRPGSVAPRPSTLPAEGDESRQSSQLPINSRIQLFWNVLYGVQHESVFTRERSAIHQLRKEFSVADADKQGKVLYDSLGRIISETYFGTKTDEEVQRLVLAAAFGNPEMDAVHAPPVETVQYSHFLDMCRETESAFLQEFYLQTRRAAAAYAAQLIQVLRDEEVIQPIVVNQAITQLTPDAMPAEVDRMCHWLCREETGSVPLDVVEERLRGVPLPPLRQPSAETEAS